MTWQASRAETAAATIISAEVEQEFEVFWEVWALLQERFVEPSRLDVKRHDLRRHPGLVQSLDDPYTTFADPEHNAVSKARLVGQL